MLAVYVVNLASPGLWLRLALLVTASVVTFVYARKRHGGAVTLVSILAGLAIATAPGVWLVLKSDTRVLAEASRQAAGIPMPDWFFSVVAYFDIGLGVVHALLGLLATILILELIGRIRT